MIGKRPKCRRLFPLRTTGPPRNKYLFPFFSVSWSSKSSKLYSLLNRGLLINKPPSSFRSVLFHCSRCKLGKRKILPFPSHGHITTSCFDLVHLDVRGNSPTISHSYNKYCVTFIDNYRRFTWTYIMHTKSEVLGDFKKFLKTT